MVDNCSFSSVDECHQKQFVKNDSLRKIEEDEIEVLHIRTKIPMYKIKNICGHHDRKLNTKFSSLKTKCCDPFNFHGNIDNEPTTKRKPRKKALETVSLRQYKGLASPPDVLVPGEKVCVECKFELQRRINEEQPSTSKSADASSSDDDQSGFAMEVESSPEKDTSFLELSSTLDRLKGVSPIKRHQLSSSSKKTQAQRKLSAAKKSLQQQIEQTMDVKLTETPEKSDDSAQKDLKLYQDMMSKLKEKFENSKLYQERIQILTVSPFSKHRTMEIFGATDYMVKKSITVKKEKGILGLPEKRKGHPLSYELKEAVYAFYENDDNSRACPGTKDYVSLNKNGIKEQHQKRLILSNLKELHAEWKKENPNKSISFSAFAALRPKWCVLVGSTGTHSVCVCKYHQNPKLMAAAFTKETIHDLMKHCVCSAETQKCMMGQCKECTGATGLVDYLNNSPDLEDVTEVSYQQWISTDRTTLVTITESVEDFVQNLSNQIVKLTRHSFTAKCQSQYMAHLKSNITPLEDVIVQCDFAENYSYVVQDEIQSFHWENKQLTVHPFVCYRRRADGSLEHVSICILSDSREHSANSVHCYLDEVVPFLKKQFPEMKKVHYFTDGCAGQYKNRFNFVNLAHHREDYGVDAEWNFFATSHGKSACDGIGGTVKRLLTKASLQRPYTDAILTSEQVLKFCSENIPGIHFINIIPQAVAESEIRLEDRFATAIQVKGTQQFHRFVPLSNTHINCYKLSLQEDVPKKVMISGDDEIAQASAALQPFDLVQKYVIAIYDENPWVGLVEDVNEEYGDYRINFMHPKKPATQLYWPDTVDKCWVEE